MTESGGERPVAQSRLGLLGMATIIASALVGFNTFVVGCSNERAARDAAQLHQIEERDEDAEAEHLPPLLLALHRPDHARFHQSGLHRKRTVEHPPRLRP